jgi:hypothetical protein
VSREIRSNGSYGFSVIDEPGQAGCSIQVRNFYWVDGRWQPPLPPDVEPPIGTGEHSRSIVRSSSSERRQPGWILREPEPWRLQRWL